MLIFVYFVHLIGGNEIDTIYWLKNIYRSVIKLYNVFLYNFCRTKIALKMNVAAKVNKIVYVCVCMSVCRQTVEMLCEIRMH